MKDCQYNADTKYFMERRNAMVKCDCGHSILFGKKDRLICSWCNKWCYKSPQVKFKYKLLEQKRKVKRNGINNNNNII